MAPISCRILPDEIVQRTDLFWALGTGFSRTPSCLASRTRTGRLVLVRPGVVEAACRPQRLPAQAAPSFIMVLAQTGVEGLSPRPVTQRLGAHPVPFDYPGPVSDDGLAAGG